MAARETVTLAYTGPALQNGEMDVRDLAPALLAAAGLVEASARVLYGSQFNVSVQVSATREGSFELDLAIVATSMFEVVRDILTGDNLAAIQTLVELVFGEEGAGGRRRESGRRRDARSARLPEVPCDALGALRPRGWG